MFGLSKRMRGIALVLLRIAEDCPDCKLTAFHNYPAYIYGGLQNRCWIALVGLRNWLGKDVGRGARPLQA